MWRRALGRYPGEHGPLTAIGIGNAGGVLPPLGTYLATATLNFCGRCETIQCQQAPTGVKHCLPAPCLNNTDGQSNKFSIYIPLSSNHAWGHSLLPKMLEHFAQAWPWAAWHGMIFVQLLEACGFLPWNCPVSKMLQPFCKTPNDIVLALDLKGQPQPTAIWTAMLGKHSTKNPITAPPTLNPLYNPNQTSPKPQPHTAFPLTLTNQTIPSCPPAAKVLQVLHQAWPWAAWHGMIFVQPLEACGFSLQWNCPINKMLQMILSWHSTWKGNPSHPQTEQLCVESKALKNL